MATIIQNFRLTKEQVERLEELFRDLYNALSSEWCDIHIMGFGSVVTGLGTKTSDVDCYIQLPRWMHPPDRSYVIRARDILMRHKHIFENAFAIVQAKVPIVQFYHIPTQVNCDINFSCPAGVENSKLIRYLLDCDKRALHLAIFVKYWSKIHHFTGTNLMTSYCLTILVIFFLQHYNMLPSVKYLQENIEELNVNDWNSAFNTTPYSDFDSDISMYELLGNFFKYYKTFEFDKYIICPYLGRPVKREDFANVESVPSEFSAYRTNVGLKKLNPLRLDSMMCVQDPFEHNRNCAVAVYPKLVQNIKALIENAVCIYENESQNDFLNKLLHSTIILNSATKKKKKQKQKFPKLNGVKKNYRQNQNFKSYLRGRNHRR
ncbi:terminal uridylyltransferase Tailor isoform X2 [Bicyclus anynana]|nr:terminal uridylyltransferase Tailor isoform X2 [Bicyclus anynana]